jgi:hypothetical protein
MFDVRASEVIFNVEEELQLTGIKTLAIAAAIAALATSSALADKPGDRGETHGLGWGKGGSYESVSGGWKGGRGNTSVGVPGPIAGAGLPLAVIVGGYVWLRRRQRRNTPISGD